MVMKRTSQVRGIHYSDLFPSFTLKCEINSTSFNFKWKRKVSLRDGNEY